MAVCDQNLERGRTGAGTARCGETGDWHQWCRGSREESCLVTNKLQTLQRWQIHHSVEVYNLRGKVCFVSAFDREFEVWRQLFTSCTNNYSKMPRLRLEITRNLHPEAAWLCPARAGDAVTVMAGSRARVTRDTWHVTRVSLHVTALQPPPRIPAVTSLYPHWQSSHSEFVWLRETEPWYREPQMVQSG